MNKINEFKKLVVPVQKWLNENYNPHATAVITGDFVKVTVDEFGFTASKIDDKEVLETTDFTGKTITVVLDGQEIADNVMRNA